MASSFSFSVAVPDARSFSIMLSPSSAFSMVLREEGGRGCGGARAVVRR